MDASEMAKIDQATRLHAAALIKSIADSGDPFDEDLAEELAIILQPMPLFTVSAELKMSHQGPAQSVEAAGIGTVKVDGEQENKSWSVGEREFRCGAYVVQKTAEAEFEIRHVGDVDSESNEGELLRLVKERGGWAVYLNQPISLSLWLLNMTFGNRWNLWKRGH